MDKLVKLFEPRNANRFMMYLNVFLFLFFIGMAIDTYLLGQKMSLSIIWTMVALLAVINFWKSKKQYKRAE